MQPCWAEKTSFKNIKILPTFLTIFPKGEKGTMHKMLFWVVNHLFWFLNKLYRIHRSQHLYFGPVPVFGWGPNCPGPCSAAPPQLLDLPLSGSPWRHLVPAAERTSYRNERSKQLTWCFAFACSCKSHCHNCGSQTGQKSKKKVKSSLSIGKSVTQIFFFFGWFSYCWKQRKKKEEQKKKRKENCDSA